MGFQASIGELRQHLGAQYHHQRANSSQPVIAPYGFTVQGRNSKPRCVFILFYLLPAVALAYVTYPFLSDRILASKLFQSSQNSQNTSCLGHSGQYNLRFESFLYLNTEFIPEEFAVEDFYKQAAAEQLQYIRTRLEAIVLSDRLTKSAMSHEPPHIEIQRVEHTTYPTAIDIDDIEPYPMENVYITQAIKAGRTAKQDKATKISYTAEAKFAFCITDERPLASVDFPLPLDPYLAYWYIDKSNRVPIRWESTNIVQVVNPCAMSEVADYPHPRFYWYFWNPFERGKDERNQRFDCRDTLREGSHYLMAKAKVTAVKDAQASVLNVKPFLQNRTQPLKISILFGFSKNEDYSLFSPAEVRSLIDRVFNASELEVAKRLLPYRSKKYDWALDKFLIFLWTLKHMADLERYSTEVTEDYVGFLIHGTFQHSQKPFRIKAYVGTSKPKLEQAKRYLQIFKEALNRDDIIIYSGHSGLGGNLSHGGFTQKLQTLTVAAKNEAMPAPEELHYQILLLNGCYTYSYFPPRNFPLPDFRAPDFRRDIIYTADAESNTEGKVMLGLLWLVDNKLSGKRKTFSDYASGASLNHLMVGYQVR